MITSKIIPMYVRGWVSITVAMIPTKAPATNTNHRRQPTPQRRRDDRADNRTGRRNRFEVVAEKNVAVGRHEIHAVHIKGRRRRPFGIGLNDIAVYSPRIARVSQVDRNGPENNGDQRVHALVTSYCAQTPGKPSLFLIRLHMP